MKEKIEYKGMTAYKKINCYAIRGIEDFAVHVFKEDVFFDCVLKYFSYLRLDEIYEFIKLLQKELNQ